MNLSIKAITVDLEVMAGQQVASASDDFEHCAERGNISEAIRAGRRAGRVLFEVAPRQWRDCQLAERSRLVWNKAVVVCAGQCHSVTLAIGPTKGGLGYTTGHMDVRWCLPPKPREERSVPHDEEPVFGKSASSIEENIETFVAEQSARSKDEAGFDPSNRSYRAVDIHAGHGVNDLSTSSVEALHLGGREVGVDKDHVGRTHRFKVCSVEPLAKCRVRIFRADAGRRRKYSSGLCNQRAGVWQ